MPDPTNTPAAGDGPLDATVIAMLRELGGTDDPGLFDELVDTFVADTPPRIRAIEAAVRNGDPTALRESAHGLKSSSANMGARMLAELCRTLEAAGKDRRLEGIEEMCKSLKDAYQSAEQALLALKS